MSAFETMPQEAQAKVNRLAMFGNLERNHFDDCVNKGLMTKEERDLEFSKLHDTIKGAIVRILISNK